MINRDKIQVAILTDGISTGIRIFEKLDSIKDIDLHILICNNNRQNPIKMVMFFLGYFFLRLKVSLKIAVIKCFFKGRIRIFFTNLKSPIALKYLEKKKYDIGIHDSSIIYTNDIISKFSKGILNSHIGLLPRYRGRCVMEWSIYEKSPTGITVFYIDDGIDTGKDIVIREEVSVLECGSIEEAKNKLFGLAPEFYQKAVESELKGNPHLINDGSGPRFYVMSKKLRNEISKYFS